jgi:VanZ family protein
MIWQRAGLTLSVIAVTVGSLLPSSSVSATTVVPDWVRHGAGYFVIALFATWALPRLARWQVFIAVVAYSILIEVLQPIVADRMFELTDIAANAVGAALGIALAGFTRYRFRSPRR